MARNDLRYFFPLAIGAIGEAGLFITLLVQRFSVFTGAILRDDIILLRVIALLGGIGILCFILAKLSSKFKKHPTRTRLIVLLAIVCFLPSAVLYFIITTWRFIDPVGTLYESSRFFFDGTVLCLMASIYCFVLFGIEILLSPSIERATARLKLVTDVTFACVLVLFLVATFAQVFPGTMPFLETLGDIPFYIMAGIGLYYLVVLVVMVVKSFKLSKKATSAVQQAGLRALGITFIILISCIILFVLNFVAFDSSKEVIVLSIWLLVVGFIFVYRGFVRPNTSRD